MKDDWELKEMGCVEPSKFAVRVGKRYWSGVSLASAHRLRIGVKISVAT